MCSRNTERVRTYLSSVAGALFVKQCDGRRTYTGSWQVCLSDQWGLSFAWETSGSLPFAGATSGFFPFVWVTIGSLPSVQNYRPYIVFQIPHENMNTPLRPRIFCLWLVIESYILPFFSVICWSYMRTKISVTLSIGNKLCSRHHILYFSFLWKPLCWCYLATALNLLSSSSPAKLVYYINWIVGNRTV